MCTGCMMFLNRSCQLISIEGLIKVEGQNNFTYDYIMMKFTKSIITFLLIPSLALCAESKYDLNQLAYPSEVQNLGKQTGSVYYSAPIKNKALMPTHMWGEVSKGGMHFIPVDSTLIKGLSYAGGASSSAKLDNVKVIRDEEGKLNTYTFDMEDGGDNNAHQFVLHPGDTIYVSRNRYFENRAYYTSLIGVIISVLSGILIYRQVKDNK